MFFCGTYNSMVSLDSVIILSEMKQTCIFNRIWSSQENFEFDMKYLVKSKVLLNPIPLRWRDGIMKDRRRTVWNLQF